MTSEVVLSNASSIVFGADTKVTVTAGPMRRESEAVKIHLLYEDPPCALMIHGRTRYCGVPWAAWANAYGRDRPKPLGSIKEIAADFFEWLAHAPLVSAEDREVEARMNAEDLAGGAISEARTLVDNGRARDLPEALDIIIPQLQAQITATTGSHTARRRSVAVTRDLALGPYAAMPRTVRRRLADLAEYARASGLCEEGTGLVFGLTAIQDQRQSNFLSASAHMAAHELAELVALLVTSATIDERMSEGVQTEVGGSVDVLVMSREVPSVRRSITRSYQLEPLGI